jgi:hypothetical protein
MNPLQYVAFTAPLVSVDRENATVRTTVNPIRDSEVATVDTEYNAAVTDVSPDVTGLAQAQAAADNTKTVRATPAPYITDYTSIIDNQVATSGTAAAREDAGIKGHGSMQYDASVEPVIRDGAVLGGTYFVRDAHPVQEGARDYLSDRSGVVDNQWSATAQAEGTAAARRANRATLYSALIGG